MTTVQEILDALREEIIKNVEGKVSGIAAEIVQCSLEIGDAIEQVSDCGALKHEIMIKNDEIHEKATQIGMLLTTGG